MKLHFKPHSQVKRAHAFSRARALVVVIARTLLVKTSQKAAVRASSVPFELKFGRADSFFRRASPLALPRVLLFERISRDEKTHEVMCLSMARARWKEYEQRANENEREREGKDEIMKAFTSISLVPLRRRSSTRQKRGHQRTINRHRMMIFLLLLLLLLLGTVPSPVTIHLARLLVQASRTPTKNGRYSRSDD